MITFVTCWYIVKSKFNVKIYQKWMKNFLGNVNNFQLIVFTNKESLGTFKEFINSDNTIVIIKEWEEFYAYKYKQDWINNHKKNILLNTKIDWKLNMLWNEKIHFVKEASEKYNNANEWYGWCDIGYFRGRNSDIKTDLLAKWPSPEKIKNLEKDKIYYSIVSPDIVIENLSKIILNKNKVGLPITPIPPQQISVAGGFFLLQKKNIQWWHDIHFQRIELYFSNNYLIKDDQMIIIDNIFNNEERFKLVRENDRKYDPWFVFQRVLL